jgi:hypothetical protein
MRILAVGAVAGRGLLEACVPGFFMLAARKLGSVSVLMKVVPSFYVYSHRTVFTFWNHVVGPHV